jgi:hypothetical protein
MLTCMRLKRKYFPLNGSNQACLHVDQAGQCLRMFPDSFEIIRFLPGVFFFISDFA